MHVVEAPVSIQTEGPGELPPTLTLGLRHPERGAVRDCPSGEQLGDWGTGTPAGADEALVLALPWSLLEGTHLAFISRGGRGWGVFSCGGDTMTGRLGLHLGR